MVENPLMNFLVKCANTPEINDDDFSYDDYYSYVYENTPRNYSLNRRKSAIGAEWAREYGYGEDRARALDKITDAIASLDPSKIQDWMLPYGRAYAIFDENGQINEPLGRQLAGSVDPNDYFYFQKNNVDGKSLRHVTKDFKDFWAPDVYAALSKGLTLRQEAILKGLKDFRNAAVNDSTPSEKALDEDVGVAPSEADLSNIDFDPSSLNATSINVADYNKPYSLEDARAITAQGMGGKPVAQTVIGATNTAAPVATSTAAPTQNPLTTINVADYNKPYGLDAARAIVAQGLNGKPAVPIAPAKDTVTAPAPTAAPAEASEPNSQDSNLSVLNRKAPIYNGPAKPEVTSETLPQVVISPFDTAKNILSQHKPEVTSETLPQVIENPLGAAGNNSDEVNPFDMTDDILSQRPTPAPKPAPAAQPTQNPLYDPKSITRQQMRQYRHHTGANDMKSDMDRWKTYQAMNGNLNASNADYYAAKRNNSLGAVNNPITQPK